MTETKFQKTNSAPTICNPICEAVLVLSNSSCENCRHSWGASKGSTRVYGCTKSMGKGTQYSGLEDCDTRGYCSDWELK